MAQAVGRKDHERAQLAFNQSQTLSMLVGLVFVTVAMLLRTGYATTQAADAATARAAADYLLWFLPAMALQFGIVAMASALRGAGNFRPGMVVQTATADELREFCRERLARFKTPHTFTPVAELPKTATGKIQKYVLRKGRPNMAAQ